MSRGNVLKMSGNMALGGGSNSDMEEIKNSLKMLKAKKNNQHPEEDLYHYGPNSVPQKNYGGSYGAPPKNSYNYQSLSKNHLPSSNKDINGDYGKKPSSKNEYSYSDNGIKQSYKNDYSDNKPYSGKQYSQQPDPYQYSNKPPSYPQSNPRNLPARNVKNIDPYQQVPSYSGKSTGSKLSNKNSEQNSYNAKPKAPQRNQYQQQGYSFNKKQQQYYNPMEQRNTKQISRQNQLKFQEQYSAGNVKLVKCAICERQFNSDRIKKHQEICKKASTKQRKQFNAQEHRIIDNQQKKLMKKGQMIEKKIQAQQKNQKVPKWKAESLAFRAVLQQNRGGAIDPRDAAIIQQAQNDAGVKCPYCGRKFNQSAGPRHIKFCQQQAKKNQMKKKK